jgi:hypothetical protein
LPAALAALLFSIHPLRVESVAWVTERRDVLSLFFSLISILCYLIHVDALKRDAAPRRGWYSVAVVAFVAALLSNATSMTLPAILALLNVHPLRRLGGDAGWWTESARRVYAEVAPFAV